MRKHGVPDFPDPTKNGGFAVRGGPGSGINPNSSTFRSAARTCQHLLPNGGKLTPAERQKALAKLLKFSQCMRSHGVPNFPDPTSSANGIGIRINGNSLDPRSPAFQAAQRACQRYVGGAPVPGGAKK